MAYGRNNYENTKRYRTKLRRKCLEKLGMECIRCGFTDDRALQIDHVKGGGKIDARAMGLSSPKYYRQIMEDNDGKYQLLCANCNQIKRVENQETGFGIPRRVPA